MLKKSRQNAELIFLANLAKTSGHDMQIKYSTIHDFYYVLFYGNGWKNGEYEPYSKQIIDDETFEKAVEDLERLIK